MPGRPLTGFAAPSALGQAAARSRSVLAGKLPAPHVACCVLPGPHGDDPGQTRLRTVLAGLIAGGPEGEMEPCIGQGGASGGVGAVDLSLARRLIIVLPLCPGRDPRLTWT